MIKWIIKQLKCFKNWIEECDRNYRYEEIEYIIAEQLNDIQYFKKYMSEIKVVLSDIQNRSTKEYLRAKRFLERQFPYENF